MAFAYSHHGFIHQDPSTTIEHACSPDPGHETIANWCAPVNHAPLKLSYFFRSISHIGDSLQYIPQVLCTGGGNSTPPPNPSIMDENFSYKALLFIGGSLEFYAGGTALMHVTMHACSSYACTKLGYTASPVCWKMSI